MRVRLRVLEGPDKGVTFLFEGYNRLVIGRKAGRDVNGRTFTDKYLSRYHFMLETVGDTCVLRDMGSRSGVVVNGLRQEVCQIREGDRVRAGRSTFRFSIERTTTFSGATAAAGDDTPVDLVRPSLGDYRDQEFIAEGALGNVYRAEEKVTGRTVALKMLKQERACEESVIEHFMREMDLLKNLHHPHIVRVYAAGRDEGRLWLAMEYVDGPNLDEQVAISGALSAKAACRYGAQVLDALAYGHQRGIIHRDVKPENILLGVEAGRAVAKVADYGLAKSFQDTGGAPLTITGQVKGTLMFMAPEQFLDAKRVGPAADLYSVGATLYHALTRTWHYDDGTGRRSRWSLLLDGPYVPIAEKRADLSPALSRAIDGALERDPRRRPKDARAMKAMLERAADELPSAS